MRKLFMYLIIVLAVSAGTDARDKGGVRLIVRADDIGVARSVNEAVIDSYLNGIVTTVELMIPTPWFPDAVKLLEENPQINVGLHLTLTSEWENMKWRPLTTASSINCDDGYFLPMIWPNPNFSSDEVLINADWSLDEIDTEFRALGHTGYEDVAADREGVTRVFTDLRVMAAIRELGIELTSYSDLMNHSCIRSHK